MVRGVGHGLTTDMTLVSAERPRHNSQLGEYTCALRHSHCDDERVIRGLWRLRPAASLACAAPGCLAWTSLCGGTPACLPTARLGAAQRGAARRHSPTASRPRGGAHHVLRRSALPRWSRTTSHKSKSCCFAPHRASGRHATPRYATLRESSWLAATRLARTAPRTFGFFRLPSAPFGGPCRGGTAGRTDCAEYRVRVTTGNN